MNLEAVTNATQTLPPFQTTFAIPLHCQACVDSVSVALRGVPGIYSISPSIANQTISITGTASPSQLVAAIQSTGRDAILRGSGASNSAAVCILELPPNPSLPSPIRGLARFVQVSPTTVLIDLSLRGLLSGEYAASIRQTGDISRGVASLGGVWVPSSSDSSLITLSPSSDSDSSLEVQKSTNATLGVVEVDKSGIGSTLLAKEFRIWEIIGRGMTVSPLLRQGKGWRMGQLGTADGATVMGVIARSAGAWDNEKIVCSCSGKTVWQEREEQVGRGML